ncbi:MAG: hypothetical protein R8G34_01700 [Paracoccaceae bacterium]|nr:hypothetical protein [Paracoccaceae bacterium]
MAEFVETPVSCRPQFVGKRQAPKVDRDLRILLCPGDVAHRDQIAHYEGGPMLFKHSLGQLHVASLFVPNGILAELFKRSIQRIKPIKDKIAKVVRDLPYPERKPIALQRSTEFDSWPHTRAEPGIQTWVWSLPRSWQVGSGADTNRTRRG